MLNRELVPWPEPRQTGPGVWTWGAAGGDSQKEHHSGVKAGEAQLMTASGSSECREATSQAFLQCQPCAAKCFRVGARAGLQEPGSLISTAITRDEVISRYD